MGTLYDIIHNVGTAVTTRVTAAKAHDSPPDAVNQFPAIIPMFDPLDMSPLIGGNTFSGTLRIVCLTTRQDAGEAWKRLYEYMQPTGSGTSIIAALRVDPQFGSAVDDSEVVRIENIGQREMAGGPFLGFDVLVSFIRSVA